MLEKKPFVNYTLDEEKTYVGETISMKINLEERALINRLKKLTNYGQDAKVIKMSLIVCEKVISNMFGDELFMKISSSDRVKPIFETNRQNTDFEKK